MSVHDLCLHLQLIGPPQLQRTGQDVTTDITYRKGWALLAYMAMHRDRWLQRTSLADLLWPDLPREAALTNLRQVLNNLRRVVQTGLPATPLGCERERIGLFTTPEFRIDLDEFCEHRALAVTQGKPEAMAWLLNEFAPRSAHLLDEFLQGIHLPGCPAFDDWLDTTRSHLGRVRRQLLAHLCTAQAAAGQDAIALVTASRLCDLDPLDETAAMRLAGLRMNSGDRRGAILALQTLERQLAAELGTRPGPEFQQQLRQWQSNAADATAGAAPQGSSKIPTITGPQLEPGWGAVLYVLCSAENATQEGLEQDAQHLLEVHQRAAALARRLDGRLLAPAGTGFLLGFGFAAAQEGSALRSALAARELMSADAGTAPLCIGICFGPVVRSTSGLLGPLPEQARRLARQARHGQILANQALRGPCGVTPLIRWQDSGADADALLLEWHTPLENPCHDALTAWGSRPLAGRSKPLQQLRQAWRRAEAGHPQWVVLQGEAGVGKTALAMALGQALREEGQHVHAWRCDLSHQHEPFASVRRGVELSLTDLADVAAQAACTLIALLETPAAEEAAGTHARNVLQAAFDVLDGMCAHAPILLIVDDLHWADQATRDLLAGYAGQFGAQTVMLLTTARKDSAIEYAGTAPLIIELEGLPARDAYRMLRQLDTKGRLGTHQRERIIASSGGIPLFIERLALAGQEEGALPLLSVHELLQLELNRLGPFREVLQLAAVIGQEFRVDLLARILPNQNIPAVLHLAATHRLILDTGNPEIGIFRHALIRDAAYASLLDSQRRTRHADVAAELARQPDANPAERAFHHEAAHQWHAALEAWRLAGQAASALECSSDALLHFELALHIARTPEHSLMDQAPALGLAAGHAAMQCQGYGSTHAHGLFQAIHDEMAALPAPTSAQRTTLFEALAGLYMGSGSQGRNQGLLIAQRLNHLADGPAQRLMACFALGNSLFWRGRFKAALAAQEEGIALARALGGRVRHTHGADDIGVLTHAFHCWTLALLGRHHEARASAEAGLERARSAGNTHSLCFMLTFTAAMYWTARDDQAVLEHAGLATRLARRHGFPLWHSMNALFSLWARAHQGKLQGIAPALDAVGTLQQAYRSGTSTARWVLADTLLTLRRTDEAAALLRVVTEDVERYQDYYCESAILGLQARCEDTAGRSGTALRRRARALAELQGAHGLLHSTWLTP